MYLNRMARICIAAGVLSTVGLGSAGVAQAEPMSSASSSASTVDAIFTGSSASNGDFTVQITRDGKSIGELGSDPSNTFRSTPYFTSFQHIDGSASSDYEVPGKYTATLVPLTKDFSSTQCGVLLNDHKVDVEKGGNGGSVTCSWVIK